MRATPVFALAATVLGVALVTASPTPRIIWNASASVSVGLYRVASGDPKIGEIALVGTPDSIKAWAEQRRYLPSKVPLVKRIVAFSGDDVCASNLSISINGANVARQLKIDSAGRPLPHWKDCRRLEQGEYFLLGDAPDSFDSRYFGPVKSDRLIGRLVPLWTK